MEIDMNRKRLTAKRCKNILLLVLFSIIFISCPNKFNPTDYDTAGGMGSFLISVSQERMILPDTPNLSHFAVFTLAFTAENGGVDKTEDRNNTTLITDPVILVPGTYSLIVSAYADSAKNRLAARGTLSSIVIVSGQNTPGNVVLRTLLAENGTGDFSWNISFNVNNSVTITSAVMTIVDSGGVPIGAAVNLLSTPIGSRTNLVSGTYTVTVNAVRSDNKTVVWNELMHIYLTLTSRFTKQFTESNFNDPGWNVTFNYNYPGGGSVTQTVMHGYTFNSSPNSPTSPTPSRTSIAYLYRNDNLPSSTPGYSLEGWYENAQGSGTMWDFANTPIHNNVTLYANWTGPIDVSSRTGANDVEKAIDYIKENPNAGVYTLYVANDTTITPQVLNVANIRLIIEGYGGAHTINQSGSGSLLIAGANLVTGNELTLRNIILAGEVLVYHLANITMSGSASVDTLTLAVNNAQLHSSLEITSNWSGSIITRLNLMGLVVNITGNNGVIDFWEGKPVLTGAGVTGTVVADINTKLGNFINGNWDTQAIDGHTDGTPNYEIALESGVGVLRRAPIVLTVQVVDNTRSLTPIEPLAINVVGLQSADTLTSIGFALAPPISGITLNGTELRYDGSGTYASGAVSIQFTATDSRYTVNPVTVNIRDGRTVARAIPVRQTNITAFNTFANTANGLNRHYELAENVTLPTGTNNWTPIGNNINPPANWFTGSFNGGGNTISNLTFSTNIINQGMFGCIGPESRIFALGLINVNISGQEQIGGIAGNSSGIISNCYVTGNVAGTLSVGGLVGINGGTVENSYFYGTVVGTNGGDVGGIVGINISTVRNCYAAGNVIGVNVEAGYCVGGIVGDDFDQSGYVNLVQNCIALNQSVVFSNNRTDYGRIAGASTNLVSNYAWTGIIVKRNVTITAGVPNLDTGTAKPITEGAGAAVLNGLDGFGLSTTEIKTKAVWETAGFRFTDSATAGPWVWDSSGLHMPSLQNVGTPQTWPAYLDP